MTNAHNINAHNMINNEFITSGVNVQVINVHKFKCTRWWILKVHNVGCKTPKRFTDSSKLQSVVNWIKIYIFSEF